MLHTKVSFQLLYSLSIMLSPINSLDKASGMPYIYIQDTLPLIQTESGSLYQLCKAERKVVQEVYRDLPHSYFSTSKRSRLRAKSNLTLTLEMFNTDFIKLLLLT